MITVHHSDMQAWLEAYDGPLFDCCVTDPPYELGFMGKSWDSTGVANKPETWRAVFDKLKPGAHLVAFSGSRTYHRMVCAIEDAGFEIRDQLCWLYGSGFPKSMNVGNGFGTALKPAHEPICLARKPIAEKSIAANVLKHGTGAINIDACRVGAGGDKLGGGRVSTTTEGWDRPWKHDAEAIRACHERGAESVAKAEQLGRFPANLCHDGSEDVLAGFPDSDGQQRATGPEFDRHASVYGKYAGVTAHEPRGDTGSAARFFYSAKAGPLDRIGTAHATVKPVDLMRWLCRLVTPPGGLILEPFAGSGTTGIAAMAEGFDCTMIEMEAEHVADIERKLAYLRGEGAMSFREHDRRRDEPQAHAGPLFG